MKIMTIGGDFGNNEIKMYGPLGEMKFSSQIGEFRERKLNNALGKFDIVFSFKNRMGFAGSLAQLESEFSTSMIGDSKCHEEFLIRALLGLHLYTDETNEFNIVVGQPISKHTETAKRKMTQMLKGTHEITVNGITKNIVIHNALITAEGGAAFWSAPRKGKVHILDFGSGTVNAATLIDGRYIDRDSFTIKQGLNTITSNDHHAFARSVCIQALKKWECDDQVLVAGGGAELMLVHVFEYFPNSQLLKPKVNVPNIDIKVSVGSLNTPDIVYLSPIFANAVGYYNIGKEMFVNV